MNRKLITNRLLERVALRLLKDKHKEKFTAAYNDFFDYLRLFYPKALILPTIISVISFLFIVFQYFLLAMALGIPISYFSVLIFTSLLSLSNMLPISLMGIGTRDTILIIIFSLLALDRESAIAFSLVILISCIINAINGFVAWVFKPVELSLV
jgi:uncharacterized protein (TIRG00374 family)